MPPDISSGARLEKVLQELEAEARNERISHEIKSLKNVGPDGDKKRREEDSEGYTTRGNYIYIEDGTAFSLIWSRLIFFGTLQILYFVAFYELFLGSSPTVIWTWIFSWVLFTYSGLGVTAGSHRLWSHKSYQARWPLRVFLMVGQCLAGQNTLYTWCRDHRVHHKFSETDADPHNSKRGFFFSHVGWLLTRNHPEYKQQSKLMYADDLLKDPVVYFQHKYYNELCTLFALLLPLFVPVYLWGESLWVSFLMAIVWRYVTNLHNTWFVNSAAHMFGHRPYNPRIQPRENPWVSFGALGEGYHNFHHTFPSDYSTSEFGVIAINPTKVFIDFMARIGLAYDLKIFKAKRIC